MEVIPTRISEIARIVCWDVLLHYIKSFLENFIMVAYSIVLCIHTIA